MNTNELMIPQIILPISSFIVSGAPPESDAESKRWFIFGYKPCEFYQENQEKVNIKFAEKKPPFRFGILVGRNFLF